MVGKYSAGSAGEELGIFVRLEMRRALGQLGLDSSGQVSPHPIRLTCILGAICVRSVDENQGPGSCAGDEDLHTEAQLPQRKQECRRFLWFV